MLEERLDELSGHLGLLEARLAEVERALAAARETELEIDWVAETLARFDAAWDALTDENRGRLVRCLVERVEVHEPFGRVTAVLVDLGLDDDDYDYVTAPSAQTATVEATP